MEENKNRIYINQEGIKVFAIKNTTHRELDFDLNRMDKLKEEGWSIYAINKEGIFFYTANCDLDGYNWCKILRM